MTMCQRNRRTNILAQPVVGSKQDSRNGIMTVMILSERSNASLATALEEAKDIWRKECVLPSKR